MQRLPHRWGGPVKRQGSLGREPRERPRRDGLIAGLAAAGLVVAGYLTVVKFAGGSALFCTAGSGCDIVQASRYAVFLGLPTALWGAGLYAAIGGLALAGLTVRRWLVAFFLAVVGVSFSVYLTFLELFVLGAVCAYCLVSFGITIALFSVLLVRYPSSADQRSPVRPARLAAFGTLTAAATVVIGAAVFAAGLPRPAGGFPEALARHLTASGAVMYGAYW